jgi:hypothetical protein
MKLVKWLRSGTLVGVGYLLSPLSWWNDLVVNLPVALAVGYGLAWLQPHWLLPGTIAGYWFSNVLAIVMMQLGAMDMVVANDQRRIKRDVLIGLGGATLYTLVVTVLIYFHILTVPEFLLDAPS